MRKDKKSIIGSKKKLKLIKLEMHANYFFNSPYTYKTANLYMHKTTSCDLKQHTIATN